jgi:ribosomal-protein-serine acetyltransferase
MQQPTTADIPGQGAKSTKPARPASSPPVGLSSHGVSQNLPAVCLRRFRPEDAPRLFEAVRESVNELCAFMTWCRPDYALADARSFIAQCEANRETEAQYNFAIFDEQDQTLLGGVGLNRIDWNHRCANIGYWVRRSRTRQGVATAAARLIARYGLEELGFQRLEILFPANNAASQRVAQKTGAKFEGALRNRLVLPDGIHDAFLYSLVAGDLTALPASPTT